MLISSSCIRFLLYEYVGGDNMQLLKTSLQKSQKISSETLEGPLADQINVVDGRY